MLSNQENFKESQKELAKSVVSKLQNLWHDKEISESEFAGVRQAIGAAFSKLNNEFMPDESNKEVIDSVLGKLVFLRDKNPEVAGAKFESFRNELSSVIDFIQSKLN